MINKRGHTGFTLVELLIVIVVIAILASISIVAFSGIQERARDVKRASDLDNLVKSMSLWSIQTGNRPIDNGSNGSGTGYGWVYASGYPISIEDVLVNAGLINRGLRDPVTPTGMGSYMFYPCKFTAGNTLYGFFARFEQPDKASGNSMSKWQTEGCTAIPMNTYGMNYVNSFAY